MRWLWSFLCLVLVFCLGCGKDTTTILQQLGVLPQNLPDTNWQEEFTSVGGFDGTVWAILAVSSNEVYVAGWFTSRTDSGLRGNGLFLWDGQKWQPLIRHDYDNAVTIYALARDSQGNLYVGGAFSQINGVSANNVAKYNKATGQWEALGGGVNGVVYALAVDSQDNLYVGGSFSIADVGGSEITANNIALWNGSNWGNLGATTGLNGVVWTLALDTNNRLYVGGGFSQTQPPLNLTLNNIGRYDPSTASWEALGAGTNSVVRSLSFTGSQLWVGGYFTLVDGTITANRIAYYDISTNSWSAVVDSTTNANGVNNAVLTVLASGTTIYLGGYFTNAGGVAASRVAKIDTSGGTIQYAALGNGLNNTVNTLALLGTTLLAGGDFTADDANPPAALFNYFAQFDGSSWGVFQGSTTSKTVDPRGEVRALAVDSNGKIYVGGWFDYAAGVNNTENIASYDPAQQTWASLGDANWGVYALAVDTSNNNLYAGGGFTNIGGTAVRYIARYDGANWNTLQGGANNIVYAILVKASNEVYVGGIFSAVLDSTNNPVANTWGIAKWDGNAWSSVDTGFNNGVTVLALDPNGVLYAAGDFTATGDGRPLRRIARLVGGKWQDVGGGVNGSVYALAFDSQGRLYVGGSFSEAGGITAYNIAMWDGQKWHALNNGLGNSTVFALAVDAKDRVYIGGQFWFAGLPQGVLLWDGKNFVGLGSGAGAYPRGFNSVYAFLLYQGFLYVGGQFSTTGDKGAVNLGKWQVP